MYPNEWRVATTRSRKGKCLRSPSEGRLVDRRRGVNRIMRNATIDIQECAGSTRDEEEMGEGKELMMPGRGTLIWSNGKIWENGTPKGNGVFTWTDRSFYVGDEFDQRQLDGLYYSGIGVPPGLGNGVPFFCEGAGNKLYGFSSVKGIPRICVWESDGEDGDIMCEIVDDTELPSSYLDGRLSGVRNELMCFSPSCFSDEPKKPGEIVRFEHKNYHLMLSLQLGVRFSVGKQAFLSRELKARDFDPKKKFWTKFPPEGSKFTPAHKSPEFRWKNYCPVVFRHLRKQFHVDPTKYILSICGNGDLRELSSPGKSGSLFFLTEDDRFMIKTVKKSEVKVLLKMLPSYYQHVCRYENSLVTKFFGVHCVKLVGGQKIRFIVMGNLFCSEYPIHERYDLKGSSYGRKTDKPECDIDETTTRKDLDLNLVFFLSKYWFSEFLKQIDIDCKFLEAEGIMDYSLLVGLHFRSDNLKNQIHSSNSELYQIENFLSGFHFLEAEFDNLNHANRCLKQSTRLGVNIPARAERISYAFDQRRPDGANIVASLSGESYHVILQFGIIDILQDYDISKKLEHAYKSLQADPTSISAVDPKSYSRRFREFIAKIFVKDA